MANRLSEETSPYLLQHADNPVDWYPWGDEAFDRAGEEDRPIFLSIGYAACHWCHVMAHESFEDPQTADLMNDHFVNIKVDREERPDVDTIYMDAVVALNGQGGWPLSVFLTPEGKPFYGGTYFPPQRRFNMPSFREVLESVHQEWSNNRDRVEQISAQLTERVQAKPAFASERQELEIAALDAAAEQLFEAYDWKHGGWGGAPKFPQAGTIEFLLQRYHRKKDRLALDMAKHVLQSMANGGIFDQVGGGFHRYAVDEKWLVPHFEKMLYDNAVLLPVYLHAWQLTGDREFLDVVNKTLDYLLREKKKKKGGFYASLDADSEGEEGIFYIWTPEQLRDALEDEEDYELASQVYSVLQGPNFEGSNILFLRSSLDELAEELDLAPDELRLRMAKIDAQLLETRQQRPRPATDDKIITAWNGLLLIALAEAARTLGNETYLQTASELAGFMISNLKTDSGWMRTWRNGKSKHNATLRDLAATGLGLLALYETDFDNQWFQEALQISESILEHYQDPDGGFYDTRVDQTDLITRPKSVQDTPFPSGNSLALQLLLQMYNFTGDGRYADPVDRALRGMQSAASRYPTAFAGWLIALDSAIGPRHQLALISNSDDGRRTEFLDLVNTRYLPFLTRAAGLPSDPNGPDLLQGRSKIGEHATAYLCQGFVCNAPTDSVEEFADQLDSALTVQSAE